MVYYIYRCGGVPQLGFCVLPEYFVSDSAHQAIRHLKKCALGYKMGGGLYWKREEREKKKVGGIITIILIGQN